MLVPASLAARSRLSCAHACLPWRYIYFVEAPLVPMLEPLRYTREPRGTLLAAPSQGHAVVTPPAISGLRRLSTRHRATRMDRENFNPPASAPCFSIRKHDADSGAFRHSAAIHPLHRFVGSSHDVPEIPTDAFECQNLHAPLHTRVCSLNGLLHSVSPCAVALGRSLTPLSLLGFIPTPVSLQKDSASTPSPPRCVCHPSSCPDSVMRVVFGRILHLVTSFQQTLQSYAKDSSLTILAQSRTALLHIAIQELGRLATTEAAALHGIRET